ncbi:hypothetical protein GGR23_003451 [Gellertiella hungarica]|uniref:Uncharacterized protein n=2 Tax=Gellertiella hungarica TaxID=1572859 RepID=A0A7W6J7H1_9HYPH|nr:hypothetical protein [Gellertiella hungarica]
MNFEEKAEPWLYALLGILTVVPFISDLIFPLGTAIWVVYLLAVV